MGMFDRFKKKTAEEIKPKKSGGHGNHWQIVSESDNELRSFVFGAIKDGETVDTLKQKNKERRAFFSQGEVLKTCTITVNNQIWTAYPFVADGIVHEIMIKNIEEWMNEQEAQIQCSLEDSPLTFFDTKYFKNKGIYEPGKKYNFSLSALAYSLKKSEPQIVKDRNGRELSTKGMAAYFPFERGDVDDFMFVVLVKEVMEFKFGNTTFYRIRAPLFRLSEDDDIDIFILARTDTTKGYVPSVGDDISGVLWLQGYMK